MIPTVLDYGLTQPGACISILLNTHRWLIFTKCTVSKAVKHICIHSPDNSNCMETSNNVVIITVIAITSRNTFSFKEIKCIL